MRSEGDGVPPLAGSLRQDGAQALEGPVVTGSAPANWSILVGAGLFLLLAVTGCSGGSPPPITASATDLSLTAAEFPYAAERNLTELNDYHLSTYSLSFEKRLGGQLRSGASTTYLVKPFPAKHAYDVDILVYESLGSAELAFRILSKPRGHVATADVISTDEQVVPGQSIGDESLLLESTNTEPICQGDPACESHPQRLVARNANVVFLIEESGGGVFPQLEEIASALVTKARRAEKP